MHAIKKIYKVLMLLNLFFVIMRKKWIQETTLYFP
jgi:hypothetical protein